MVDSEIRDFVERHRALGITDVTIAAVLEDLGVVLSDDTDLPENTDVPQA